MGQFKELLSFNFETITNCLININWLSILFSSILASLSLSTYIKTNTPTRISINGQIQRTFNFTLQKYHKFFNQHYLAFHSFQCYFVKCVLTNIFITHTPSLIRMDGQIQRTSKFTYVFFITMKLSITIILLYTKKLSTTHQLTDMVR